MKAKRNVRGLVLAFVLAVGLVMPLAANAQDTGTTGTRTQCDSTLILLAGLAQRYFGFTSMSGMDMNTFEFGQYSQFWSTNPAQSMDGTSSTGNTAGQTAGGTTASSSNTQGSGGAAAGSTTGGAEAQATPDASGGGTGGTGAGGATSGMSSVYLNPPTITDENPACMQLRAELEAFFTSGLANADWDTRFRSGMTGGMGGASGSGSTDSGTQEPSGTTSGG